ncbi:MAG: DUF3786 domain-containing protein [Candidatus Bathyarchaeia archaeon]
MDEWDNYSDIIHTVDGNLGFKMSELEFLAYKVELDSGKVFDKLLGKYVKNPKTLYVLLSHYAKAKNIEEVGKLIKFRELPGGYAYERAFKRRAEIPIAETFGTKPKMLVEAAKVLSGVKADYGDYSVKIPALPKIPITYVLWKSNEFPTACSALFDESASHYLPTEDLAVIGQLTTTRIKSPTEVE